MTTVTDPVLREKYNANRCRKYWRERTLKRPKGARWQRVVRVFAFEPRWAEGA